MIACSQKAALMVALVSLVGAATAQLTAPEKQALSDALSLGNMTAKELNGLRASNDPRLPGIARLALNRPLDFITVLAGMKHDSASEALASCLKTGLELKDAPVAAPVPTVAPTELPPELGAVLVKLVNAVQLTNTRVKGALGKLTPAERRELVELLPTYANNGRYQLAFAKKEVLDPTRIETLLEKVDLAEIQQASLFLAQEVERATPLLKVVKAKYKFDGLYRAKLGGLMVEVSGKDAQTMTSSDASVGICLGARSRISGRYGAGVGYSAVWIDLGNETTYDAPDASIGAGILGIGVASISGPRHVAKGKSLCFGAGLAGVGVLMTDGGQNSFDAQSMSQGFGQFGVGLLWAKGGENTFKSQFLSQGASRTGGIGWLALQAGRNNLRATSSDKSVAWSQGASLGYSRSVSGGLGLLTLSGGEDQVFGGNASQGAGSIGGVGALYASGKPGTFACEGMGLGFGTRLGAGYLCQIGSGFQNMLKHGQGYGSGFDRGVGFLLGRGNSNVYAGRDLDIAHADAGSVGVVISSGDENLFTGRLARGDKSGEPGLAVFASVGSSGEYPDGWIDGSAGIQEGSGLVVAGGDVEPKAEDPPKSLPASGSVPMPSEAEMRRLCSRLPDNIGTVVGIGKPALEWIIKNRLRSLDDESLRAVAVLTRSLGTSGEAVLAEAVGSTDDDLARIALNVANLGQCKSIGPVALKCFDREPLAEQVAKYVGSVRMKEAVEPLLALCGSPDRAAAVAAMVALGQIQDERAVSTAQALILSEEAPMRRAALILLAQYPVPALTTARNFLSTSEARSRAIALELLRLVDAPEAPELASQFLTDPNPQTRIQALLAVNGRCPIKSRSTLMDLKRDQNALVRSVATRISMGH